MTETSIIIPYFKKKLFINDCLNSILNQTYKNYEIILIYDDPDKSELEYLMSFKRINKKKSKIKIIDNKKNIGAGSSRNKGLKIARGDYIAFLDADDIWHSEKLQNQINFMKMNNINFSHTSYKIFSKNRKVAKFRRAKKKLDYKELLKSCDIGLSTVIIKKSFLKNNKFANIKTKEDYVLWLKLAKKENIYGIDKVHASWRKLENSLSSSIYQKIKDGFKVYYLYEKFSFLIASFMVIRLSYFFLIKLFIK